MSARSHTAWCFATSWTIRRAENRATRRRDHSEGRGWPCCTWCCSGWASRAPVQPVRHGSPWWWTFSRRYYNWLAVQRCTKIWLKLRLQTINFCTGSASGCDFFLSLAKLMHAFHRTLAAADLHCCLVPFYVRLVTRWAGASPKAPPTGNMHILLL